MSLVTILIALLIFGLLLYAVGLVPLPHPFGLLAKALVVVLFVVWLARTSGLVV